MSKKFHNKKGKQAIVLVTKFFIYHFEGADITNPRTGGGGPSEREVQDQKVRKIKSEN